MEVITGARIHFGLIDLNGEIGRIDGGIGLGVKSPSVKISGEIAEELSVSGPGKKQARNAASAVLEEINGDPAQLRIHSSIPQHIGLGSGTQLALAAGRIVSELNGVSLSSTTLAKMTGRGGTSGIGTAVFGSGGFILDGGHDFREKSHFLPSSSSEVSPPPVLSQMNFPNWNITIFVPEGKGVHNSAEEDFFTEKCPISKSEVEKLCHVILMKLLPAIKEEKFSDFRDSIIAIQNLGFKKEEITTQPRSKEIIDVLVDEGCAAGLSSFGPAVYAISPDEIDITFDDCTKIETKTDRKGSIVHE